MILIFQEMGSKLVLVTLSLLVLIGCTGGGEPYFLIEGSLINGRNAGKAKLYKFMPEYDELILIDSANVENGNFQFVGHVDNTAEAYVSLDSCNDAFCFILSNDLLDMKIGCNGYIVKGTPDNELLSSLIMRRQISVNERARIQNEYVKLQKDSTLTKAIEDSLLNLYRMQSVGLSKTVFTAIESNYKKSPEFADIAFRMFSSAMSENMSDSIVNILKSKN